MFTDVFLVRLLEIAIHRPLYRAFERENYIMDKNFENILSKNIISLLEDTELSESIKTVGNQLDDNGKHELGKALSNVYSHGYEDCIKYLASQNHVSIVGIN